MTAVSPASPGRLAAAGAHRLVPPVGSTAPLPWALVALVAGVAFAARLVPVLRGGGLFGLGDYDDGVYYGAAVGFVHGRLPYRDFLLLHPPGVVLALAPFALLGRLVGDPIGFALARLGWMALGALNAVLVIRIVRPAGAVASSSRTVAALLGGLAYAFFLPAVYGEHTTLLEGLANTCLLLALLLLTRRRLTTTSVALAGAALGAATGVKIWGAVAVLLVAGWLLVTAGRRRAATLLLGAVGGATAVCLPFFLAAPRAMFRLVVLDQLGRPRSNLALVTRVRQLLGLWSTDPSWTPLVLGLLLVVILLAALAATVAHGRLAVLLLAGLTAMLLATPSWFPHYTAAIAGPAALTLGYGVAALLNRIGPRPVRRVVTVALVALVVASSAPLWSLQLNHRFPGKALGAAVAHLPGCVTGDEPTGLIEMDVLGRNLHRGCRRIVDGGGEPNHEPGPHPAVRSHDPVWQRFALSYLKTGRVVLSIRFNSKKGFSRASAATVHHWPVLHRVGRYTLREPRG